MLHDDPGSYDANRMLGTLYLSQHRFQEAIRVGERNRDERPYDPVNYGVIGDAHVELGNYDEAFTAFDQMMALRPARRRTRGSRTRASCRGTWPARSRR